jgi:hypothetical protein
MQKRGVVPGVVHVEIPPAQPRAVPIAAVAAEAAGGSPVFHAPGAEAVPVAVPVVAASSPATIAPVPVATAVTPPVVRNFL